MARDCLPLSKIEAALGRLNNVGPAAMGMPPPAAQLLPYLNHTTPLRYEAMFQWAIGAGLSVGVYVSIAAVDTAIKALL